MSTPLIGPDRRIAPRRPNRARPRHRLPVFVTDAYHHLITPGIRRVHEIKSGNRLWHHLPKAPQLGWSATFLRVDQHLHTLLSSDLQWEFSVKRCAWSGALAGSPYLAQLEIVLNQRAPEVRRNCVALVRRAAARTHPHRVGWQRSQA